MAVCLLTVVAKPIVMTTLVNGNTPHRFEVPTVDKDGDVITISSDSVTQAEVYIKDEYGNVLTASSMLLSPGGDQILVPEDSQDEMLTIEVHTENDTFTGFINN